MVFEIGSITKEFTPAIIMKLQAQGQLRVDDSIATYLPEYGFSQAITLRMLLNHTSGLANFTDFPQFQNWMTSGVSETTALTAVSPAVAQFPPGTQYSYSNSNFFALGTIIEKIAGQPIPPVWISTFQALGLPNTYYALPPANGATTGYQGSGLLATIWDRSAAFAAGALSSNVYDHIARDNALMNGKKSRLQLASFC